MPLFRSLFCATAFLVGIARTPGCEGEPTPAPAPAEALPSCIDERCIERPEYFKCVEWAAATSDCTKWQILYVNHCECRERAVAKPDGGSP